MKYITPTIITLFIATVVFFPDTVDGRFFLTTLLLLALGWQLRKQYERR